MTNRIMVFGGGTVFASDGIVRLHPRSLERVDRVIGYFNTNKELFSKQNHINKPFILCTGGFGLLADGVTDLEANEREAVLMADYLVERGNIPREIILLEQESTSTLTNWTNSFDIYKELLDIRNYSETKRLGLVSHPFHLARVVFLAEKLGYKKEQLELIPTSQIDNKDYEAQVLNAYRDYLKDATKPKDMLEGENKLVQNEKLMSHLRSLQ